MMKDYNVTLNVNERYMRKNYTVGIITVQVRARNRREALRKAKAAAERKINFTCYEIQEY